MSEATSVNTTERRLKIRHRGRLGQVSIYFGKLIRMFVYQNDWKVLPMAALIAGIVSMVVRKNFFVNQEGTLKGAFALTCVAIWNGCFNSIQVICRERAIIKREHRSGMHISSYIASHMLYQALLCLAQTVLTLYVCSLMGVKFPSEGLITDFMILDLGITVFLMTYASDMLSLWISALVHSTTTAMTVMPFILIFQLVFSGGIFNLPAWTDSLSYFTISNCGFKCVAAQSDYNNLPLSLIWTTINKFNTTDQKVNASIELGTIMDILTNDENEFARNIRSREVPMDFKLSKLLEDLGVLVEDESGEIDVSAVDELSREAYNALVAFVQEKGIGDADIKGKLTVGQLLDYVIKLDSVQSLRGKKITINTNVHDIIQLIGEERLKTITMDYTKAINAKPAYDKTVKNVTYYWLNLAIFIAAFALLATITLEFIDKDKR